jgi:hypothetical protein
MSINKEKLEKLLIANWTKFLDSRQLLSLATQYAKPIDSSKKPESLTISRFELTDKGFIIWLDFTINNKNVTSEILLFHSGEVLHLRTLET